MWPILIFIAWFGMVFILNIYVMNNKQKYREIKRKTWREKVNS